jgi:hypothetical protein
MAQTDDIEWCKSQARYLVRSGFWSRDAVIQEMQYTIESDGLEDTLSAEDIVDEEIKLLADDQRSWDRKTDFDRLEAAYAALNDTGIIPRHNFTCCGTCGGAEIGYEIEDAQERGSEVQGYVFYHQQDTESAIDGHGLYFNYGAADPNSSDADHVAIGQKLADALSAAGLKVDWNGQLNQRVGVSLDWKRKWGSETKFV